MRAVALVTEGHGMAAERFLMLAGMGKEHRERRREMGLVEYAEYELDQAGLFEQDSDYGGMLGNAVLELVEKFAEQGHSGCSAELATHCASRLMQYKPLTPIEQPVKEDWNVCDMDESVFQHRRCSSLFSNDKGKTWYNIDLPRRCWWKPWTWLRGWYVRFPYMPK